MATGKVKSAITKVETDLAFIRATGTTNTTGAVIPASKYFYLNDVLVKAKTDIAVNATFTSGTNYETVTAGALNNLMGKPDYDRQSLITEHQTSYTWTADEDCYLFVSIRNLTANGVASAYISGANGIGTIFAGTFYIVQSIAGNYQQDVRFFPLPKGCGITINTSSGEIRSIIKVPCA